MCRAILCIALAACGGARTVGTLQAAIDEQLAQSAKSHGVAGQAVLILRDGKPVYRGSHGSADREAQRLVRPDDLFPVFSVSKLFASVLIMQLVERGELALEHPVGRYLPELPERWRAIEVGQFLDHVSGVPDYLEGDLATFVFPATREAAFAALANKPMQFATGTRTQYNQTNFLVLGAILEAHYKVPYRQLVTDRIVTPLGLRKTYLGKSQVPGERLVKSYRSVDDRLASDLVIAWPEYSLVHTEVYSTIDDLGAFLIAMCDERLVKRETLLRLWKPHRHADGETGWFAAGWEYGTSGRYRYVGHEGGGKLRVRLMFGDSLERDTYVIIYLTNGSATNVWSRTLLDAVVDIVLRYEPAREATSAPKL